MEAHYRAFGGKLVVKVEGTTIKDLFQQIGPLAEVLDGDTHCGKCNSPNIYPRCREAQGYDYYELVCSDCDAKLSFGQRKDGGMWAKRKHEDGSLMDHRGWYVYLGNEAPKEQRTQSAPRSGPRPSAPPASAQSSDDPQFQAMMNARTGGEWQNAAFAMYAEEMEKPLGQDAALKVWDDVLLKHGDPYRDFALKDAVSRALWAEVLKIRRETKKA